MVDVLEDPNNYYACMEHVEGRDLFDYFLQEKIYARSYRLILVRQLCRSLLTALEELHQHGLVHKDLKLENVVFDEVNEFQTGEKLVCTPKLIDFDTVLLKLTLYFSKTLTTTINNSASGMLINYNPHL